MAINIHHGANGSYKSSGVVDEYFIPAAIKGRLVVTNIRGMSTQRTFENLSDTADDFEVIYVDTSTTRGREKIAKWFHWVPFGALCLFDEPSTIFPKRWRDSDLKKLDNVEVLKRMDQDETFNEEHPDWRPPTFNEAFEMHRHMNWDIVIMTPNIKLVRSDIRDTSEGGYKHRNNALIGFKGSYNQGFHKAEDNGTNPSQFLTVEKRKIKPIVFKLYDSTKTGKHQDTTSGTTIWKNGRFVVSLVVSLFALGYSAYSYSTNDFLFADDTASISEVEAVPRVSVQASVPENSDLSVRDVPSIKVNTLYTLEPFAGHSFVITGYLSSSSSFLYSFTAKSNQGSFPITSTQLEQAGYSVISITDCAATIVFKSTRTNVNCGVRRGGAEPPKQPSTERIL